MSKSGRIWRKEIYEIATKDAYADRYENNYTDKKQELYQRYWLQAKRRHDWCEAWF